MSKWIYALLLALALTISVGSTGCQSTGGGNYSGSDGHAGHSH